MNIENDLKELGIYNWKSLGINQSRAFLLEEALSNEEGSFADNGAFVILTGSRTGRSPLDRYIVKEESSEKNIDWGEINIPISEEVYEHLYQKVTSFFQEKKLYIQQVFVGVDEKYRIPLQMISHRAWGALFAQTLFIQPDEKNPFTRAEFTVLHAPGLKLNPNEDGVRSEVAVVINFAKKVVLVIGTGYGGEIKKAMFSVMNYYLPLKGVLSMHCSANVGEKGDVALFFGLSGTGKTSLSADPERRLIGDDEHGWSDDGVFNFEGGCYAKVINLDPQKEPQIYNAIRFGSLAENVIMDSATRKINFYDNSITENTRATYPVEFIDNALIPGKAGHPKNILFLTADAYGVLPPISKLTPEMAMFHFISGYTSKLAGTETGITEPQATFSACFGAPFLPLSPITYAKLLGEKMQKHQVSVWLVNTGWSGGPYGIGNRIDIRYTRSMVRAALEGELEKAEFYPHPVFKVLIPSECPGVPSTILNPRNTWEDKEAYDKQAKKLAKLFNDNFKKFKDIPQSIKEVAPQE